MSCGNVFGSWFSGVFCSLGCTNQHTGDHKLAPQVKPSRSHLQIKDNIRKVQSDEPTQSTLNVTQNNWDIIRRNNFQQPIQSQPSPCVSQSILEFSPETSENCFSHNYTGSSHNSSSLSRLRTPSHVSRCVGFSLREAPSVATPVMFSRIGSALQAAADVVSYIL